MCGEGLKQMLGISISNSLGASGVTASTPAPLQIVAGRGAYPKGSFTESNSAQVKKITRTSHYLGGQDVTEIRLVFGGYVPSAGVDAALGNDVAVRAAIEISGTTVPCTFDGAQLGTIPDGDAEYISDPIYPSDFSLSVFAAGTQFWTRVEREVALNDKYPTGDGGAGITGEGTIEAPTGEPTQVYDTGVLLGTGNWTAFAQRLKPVAVIGRFASPEVSVVIIGDSIIYSLDDDGGDGIDNAGGGFAVRALGSVGGRSIPWCNLALIGDTIERANSAYGRKAIFKYATHLLTNYGTNDLGSRTFAQIRDDRRTFWTYAKSQGVQHVAQTSIIPKTTGAWSLADGSDQTTATECGSGENRDLLNAQVSTDISGGEDVDEYIDVHTGIIENTVAPDAYKWEAGTTDDGSHPQPSIHAGMATPVATAAASWTAT